MDSSTRGRSSYQHKHTRHSTDRSISRCREPTDYMLENQCDGCERVHRYGLAGSGSISVFLTLRVNQAAQHAMQHDSGQPGKIDRLGLMLARSDNLAQSPFVKPVFYSFSNRTESAVQFAVMDMETRRHSLVSRVLLARK